MTPKQVSLHERVPGPLRRALEGVNLAAIGAAAIAGGFIPSMGLSWVPVTVGDQRYLQVLFCGWAACLIAAYALFPIFRGLDWVLARYLGPSDQDLSLSLQDDTA